MKDPALRSISPLSRGVWIDLLCVMFESEKRGYLQMNGKAPSEEQIARMVGCSVDEISLAMRELREASVFSTSANGIIYSRRIVREEELRNIRANCGSLGGNPSFEKGKPNPYYAKDKQKDKQEDKQKITPSSSSSSSLKEETKELCGEPTKTVDSTADVSPPKDVFLEFPVVGTEKKHWILEKKKLSEWKVSFPGVNVEAECRKAWQWINDNTTKRKTFNGMLKFLNGWLSRAQNSQNFNGGKNGKSPIQAWTR